MKIYVWIILLLSALIASQGCNKVTTTCASAYLMNTFVRLDTTNGLPDTVVTISSPAVQITADICWTSAPHTSYWPNMTGPKGYVPEDSIYCHHAHMTNAGYEVYGKYDCYDTVCGMGFPALVSWH